MERTNKPGEIWLENNRETKRGSCGWHWNMSSRVSKKHLGCPWEWQRCPHTWTRMYTGLCIEGLWNIISWNQGLVSTCILFIYLSINIFYLKTELLREKIRNGKRPGCYKWDILKWHVFPNLTIRLWKQWPPKTWEIPQENSYKEIKCLPEGELVRKAILYSCKYLSNYLIAWNKAQPVVSGTTPWSIMLRYAYVTLI